MPFFNEEALLSVSAASSKELPLVLSLMFVHKLWQLLCLDRNLAFIKCPFCAGHLLNNSTVIHGLSRILSILGSPLKRWGQYRWIEPNCWWDLEPIWWVIWHVVQDGKMCRNYVFDCTVSSRKACENTKDGHWGKNLVPCVAEQLQENFLNTWMQRGTFARHWFWVNLRAKKL